VNFRAIVYDLLGHEALRIVQPQGLVQALVELLQDRAAAKAMGARARRVFDEQSGATERCVAALRELLAVGPVAAKPAEERAI
jgi:3-deoxy-D-manno-octulosonic-acid transferase